MSEPTPILRPGGVADLPAANAVIERAVMTWDLPERVKRLALPTYRYDAHDLDHLVLTLAVSAEDRVLGVAAWEPAAARDCPPGRRALLLHGIYVDPEAHRRGLGSTLLAAADGAARGQGLDGLLVKAQRGAEGFFLKTGFTRLAVQDPQRDYPHRLWRDLAGGAA